MNRREFLETVAAAAFVPAFSRQAATANEWAAPVFDLHFHLRKDRRAFSRISTATASRKPIC